MAREDAVLALQRHEIRDGAERDEIEVIAQFDFKRHRVVLGAQLFQQAVNEFEDEAHRAEVPPRRIAVGLVGLDVRIDEQALVEGFFLRAMMVDHHDVDALPAQIRRLLVGIRAAIERDEKVRLATLQRPVDRAPRKTVAILGAARHDETRVEPEAAQDHHEQRGAAHAIDIVVAEHDHFLAARDRLAQPRRRGGEITEQKGIGEAREHGLEKGRRRVALAHTGAMQQFGEHPAHAGVFAQAIDLLGRGRRVGPAHGFVFSLAVAREAKPTAAIHLAGLPRRLRSSQCHDEETYSEALLVPCHSYFGATSACASTCFRSPLCHQ